MKTAVFTPATAGECYLMLGSVVCAIMLAGAQTDGLLAMVEARCPPGSGPGPHTDPWRESFRVIEGEFEFMLESDGALRTVKAGPGDVVSIPAGVGHAFRAVSQQPARVLILSVPAGLDRFFAEAGERVSGEAQPATQVAFDRARFEQATDRHGIRGFQPASPVAGPRPSGEEARSGAS